MAPLWPCTCPHRQEFRQGHSLPVSWNILWCSQLWEDRRPLRSCYKAISYLPLSHPWESVLRQFLFTSLLWWSIGLLFPPSSRIELQSIKLPSCSLIWVLCIAVTWAYGIKLWRLEAHNFSLDQLVKVISNKPTESWNTVRWEEETTHASFPKYFSSYFG